MTNSIDHDFDTVFDWTNCTLRKPQFISFKAFLINFLSDFTFWLRRETSILDSDSDANERIKVENPEGYLTNE